MVSAETGDWQENKKEQPTRDLCYLDRLSRPIEKTSPHICKQGNDDILDRRCGYCSLLRWKQKIEMQFKILLSLLGISRKGFERLVFVRVYNSWNSVQDIRIEIRWVGIFLQKVETVQTP